jgi:hypothetical protein
VLNVFLVECAYVYKYACTCVCFVCVHTYIYIYVYILYTCILCVHVYTQAVVLSSLSLRMYTCMHACIFLDMMMMSF